MTSYYEAINKQETLRLMKKHLKFLEEYTKTTATKNKLKDRFVEEKEVMDYLPYTRSILYQNKRKSTKAQSTRVIEAIERRDKRIKLNQRLYEERKQHYLWLMNGIKYCSDDNQRLLLDKYVHALKNEQLCNKRNHISLSTLNRQLNKACLQLAQLLELEVPQ